MVIKDSPRTITGIGAILSQFRLIFVDQWGVMHNGVEPYPGAIDCLERCIQEGCCVISISNSSRDVFESEQNLKELGFKKKYHYHGVITSGETVLRRLEHYRNTLGNKVYSLNWTLGDPLLGTKDWVIEDDIRQADWILCSGVPHGCAVSDFYDDLLQAIKQNLVLVCANPDALTVLPDNSLNTCPGAFAQFYENQGGKVIWHGKPGEVIYQAALEISGISETPRKAILGIGDSLVHDIAGISRFGGAGCLITNGIHRGYLKNGSSMQQKTCDLASKLSTPLPHYLLETLRW